MAYMGQIRRKIRAWLRRHSYSFFSSLGGLVQHKVGSLMTIMVLGIAMFLPLGLYVTLNNLERINLRPDEWNTVTVFFKPATRRAEVQRLADTLQKNLHPEALLLISPAEGMAEFRQASGFGDSLDMLEENPLPWVLQVSLAVGPAGQAADNARQLTAYLHSIDSVDLTQFDYKWLQRLSRMLALGQAMVKLLVLLFGLTVVVVVANTIRLDVAAHTNEIEVLTLVGASNAFIRQPFLYSGLWYGLLGGLLAVLLLHLTLLFLGRPLGLLLETYGTVFRLQGPGIYKTGGLLMGGALLGWLGAWMSVQRYLRLLVVGGRLGRH